MKICCGRVVKAIYSKSVAVILVGSSTSSIRFLEVWSFILLLKHPHLPTISTQGVNFPDTIKQLLLLPKCNNKIFPLKNSVTFY